MTHRLAIVGALHDEIAALLPCLADVRVERRGGRDFHLGCLDGHDVVLVRAGIGKVSAAATAAILLDAWDARAVLFTGVAGGLREDVRVGDVVVATELLQHDLDASPLFPRYEVPLTGRSRFPADEALSAALRSGVRDALARPCPARAGFGLAAPVLHAGLVVSGDRFVATTRESAALRAELPDALAVEMEGAALAQVAADFGRPVAVVRTVSDRADDQAHVDFPRFLAEVAAPYSRDIVRATLLAMGSGLA